MYTVFFRTNSRIFSEEKKKFCIKPKKKGIIIMKYSIGVDLGGTNIAVGIVDESYQIIKKGSDSCAERS